MKYILGIIGIALGLLAGVWFMVNNQPVLAGVSVGSEYNATTTFAAHPLAERVLKTGSGTLGSVVITGDNTGLISFYNATTSNINARIGNTATATILIADFPASSPEGTYTFDTNFNHGLLMVTSGTEATSTVTWR